MKITELFDNPVVGTSRAGQEHHRLNFNIDDRQYQAIIELFEAGDWEASFTTKSGDWWTGEATGTGSEIKVFSTVVNFVVQFLTKHLNEVRTLVFTSDLESRTKLYTRMAKLCANKFNLELSTSRNQNGETEFVLTNPAYNEAG